MYHGVITTRALFLDESLSRGQVVSVHKDRLAATDKARKLNERSDARYDEPDFVAIHSPDGLRKGQIDEGLIDMWAREERDRQALILMTAILSMELTGKSDIHAENAGLYLEKWGMTLEEFCERYEARAREEHAAKVLAQQELAFLKARGAAQQKAVDSLRNEITYSVPAVRGIQAGKEFYLVQVPYAILVKMFVFDEEQVPAELRAQRNLNPKRSQAISDYMLANPEDYVLPTLTASVSKAMHFEPIEGADHLGILGIPLEATMLINDGQHRRYAIELALKADQRFYSETAPVQIHFDQGLKRSQQMFADINSKQVKPSSAINALYDHRNPFNSWILDLLNELPDIKRRIDFENASPGQKSFKLWSLIAFKKSISQLTRLSEKTICTMDSAGLQELVSFIQRFFKECDEHLPQWRAMMLSSIPAIDVREQYVIGHAVFLEALAMFGRVALFSEVSDTPNKVINPSDAVWEVMQKLAAVEPSKAHADWQGRCVHLGKMQKTSDGIKSTAAQLLKLAEITLPADLEEVDSRITNHAA